jgi:hypothetical protein
MFFIGLAWSYGSTAIFNRKEFGSALTGSYL